MKLFIQRLKELYRIIFKFVTRDIWRLDFSEFGKARRRAIRYLKALIITFKGFSGQRIAREAIALSYFGLMAIVPIVALILFVASGFKLDKMLSDLLYSTFPTSTQMIDAVLNFANNILVTTKKGTFGWISFGAFAWLVIWLMINVESAFNRIWMVKEYTGIGKRIVAYLAILLLSFHDNTLPLRMGILYQIPHLRKRKPRGVQFPYHKPFLGGILRSGRTGILTAL